MYADPKLVRTHRLKLTLTDYENEQVDRLVAETGQQKAVVVRELLMSQVQIALLALKKEGT